MSSTVAVYSFQFFLCSLLFISYKVYIIVIAKLHKREFPRKVFTAGLRIGLRIRN
jgi:hypothetical protein